MLAGVHLGLKNSLLDTTEDSIKELAELAETAGLSVVGTFVQNRHTLESGTYLGDGKLEEIAEYIKENDIEIIVFDDELSGMQTRNISSALKIPVIDRSGLILDIFAQRAQTKEGKLQVELAQLRYLLPRLVGSAAAAGVSRAGVGVGARGPGETKLETDKRQINSKISAIKEQLKEIEANRSVARKSRQKSGTQQVALLGYTNAGKSTLLNALTNSDVLAKDMLFATLDPTARKLVLEDGAEIVIIDTVGFIRKLPHHLIKAFSSTLEESLICDVLIHVIDSSSKEMNEQIAIVDNLLASLGASDKPIIKAYNKIDKIEGELPADGIGISAKNLINIDELLQKIQSTLPEKRSQMQILIPYNFGDINSKLHQIAQVMKEDFKNDGVYMEITISEKDANMLDLARFSVNN